MMSEVIQLYGLIFLLGSFTVASLSDLRRMAAQKDFAEVWALFTMILFAYDLYVLTNIGLFLLKWSLIVLFLVIAIRMTNTQVISFMDVTAVCAVISLLGPAHIVIYFALLLVTKEILSPILRKFGEGGSYPFLPIVWTATVVILGLLILKVADSYIPTLHALF